MSARKAPLVVDGWAICGQPLFLGRLEAFLSDVERTQAKDPIDFNRENCAKRLRMIANRAFKISRKSPRGLNTCRATRSAIDSMRRSFGIVGSSSPIGRTRG